MYTGICRNKYIKDMYIQGLRDVDSVWNFIIDNQNKYYDVSIYDNKKQLVLHSINGKPDSTHLKSNINKEKQYKSNGDLDLFFKIFDNKSNLVIIK